MKPCTLPITRFSCTLLSVLAGSGLLAFPVWASPVNGTVQQGTATISEPGVGQTQITQTTTGAEITWDSFNISSGESVTFSVPGSNGYTLNQINSTSESIINGQLSSNGTLILANPNGVFFGADSSVDVQSLIATTADASLSNDMLTLSPSTAGGQIVHSGNIDADGTVAFFSPDIDVSGQIGASEIRLSNHTTGTISLLDSPIGFSIDDATADRLDQEGINLTGSLDSDGGYIELTSAAEDSLLRGAVNMDGLISASSLNSTGGTVSLVAEEGTARVSGEINAESTAGVGGTVTLDGQQIALLDTASISTSGDAGGGEVRIGVGEGSLDRASRLYLGKQTTIDASATGTGDGGRIEVDSDEQTRVFGALTATGAGSGQSGGRVITSSVNQLLADADVSVDSPLGDPGEWLLEHNAMDITSAVAFGTPSFNNLDELFDPTFDASTSTSLLTIRSLEQSLGLNSNVLVRSTATDSDITVSDPLNLGIADINRRLTLEADRNVNLEGDITGGNSNAFSLTLSAGNEVEFSNSTVATETLTLLTDTTRSTNGGTFTVDASNVILQDGMTWGSDGTDIVFTGNNSSIDSTLADEAGVVTFNLLDSSNVTHDLTLGAVGLKGNGMGQVNVQGVDTLFLAGNLRATQDLDFSSVDGSIELLNDISIDNGGGLLRLANLVGNNHTLVVPTGSDTSQVIRLNDISSMRSLSLSTAGNVFLEGNTMSVSEDITINASRVELGNSLLTIYAGDDISINAPLEGALGGASGLEFSQGTGGDLQLQTVGASQPLDHLSIQSDKAVFMGSSLSANTFSITAPELSLGEDFTMSLTGDADFKGTAINSANQDAVTLIARNIDALGDVSAGQLTIDAQRAELGGDLTSEAGGSDFTSLAGMTLLSDVHIRALGSGDMTLPDNIAGGFALQVSIERGDLQLGTQNANSGPSTPLSSLSVNDLDTGEGTNRVGSHLYATNELDLSGLGLLSGVSDLTLVSGAGNVNLSDTAVNVDAAALSVQASGGPVSLSDVTAGTVQINSTETRLDGEVVSAAALDLSQAGPLVLDGNSRLTGELDFGTEAQPVSINGNGVAADPDYRLVLDGLGQDLTLYEVGGTSALGSVSVTNVGTIRLTEPLVTSGSAGISLSGGQWVLEEDTRIDTSATNGQINLAGIDIDGAFGLALDAGVGRITLGNIGQTTELTGLTVDGVSVLQLGGDLTTQNTELDFSMAQNLELTDDTRIDLSAQDGVINLGEVPLDGTYDLNLLSGAGAVMLGPVGQRIALQSLTINTGSDLTLDNPVSVVDGLGVDANTLALNTQLDSSGGSVQLDTSEGLIMDGEAYVSGYQGVSLVANAGNILLAEVVSDQGDITATATEGAIRSSIGDFVDAGNTSVNLTADRVNLTAGQGLGAGPLDPIVLDVALDGLIELSLGTPPAYVVNINGTELRITGGTVFDPQQAGQVAATQYLGLLQGEVSAERPFQLSTAELSGLNNPVYAVARPGFVLPSNLEAATGQLSENRPAVPGLRRVNGRWQFQYPLGTRQ